MDDLLKDAIADAKAVRETAIANAKLALEEAFTPKLQNMLSAKIQNEIDLDEEEHEDEEQNEEEEEEMEAEGRGDDKMARDGDELENEMRGDDKEVEEGEHEDEEQNEEDDMDMDADDEEMDDDELDLEAIIKELEAEINEEDEEEPKEESVNEEDDESEKKDESVNEEEEDEPKEESVNEEEEDEKKDDVKEDAEFNLDEILDALKEESDEESDDVSEISKVRAELEETREAVKFMRDKLNEVNLLNAKLLFTNKLFRAYGLNNEQKMKVVETFDRASNIREVKLVYSTMAETFGAKKTEIKESKGSASKAVASTKREKQEEVISEGNELRNRFKKLANII